MPDIETDYLVIGAGASGMAFADALASAADAELVLVDRRHAPGGHWLDAYPFVRLHQPSAYYGVTSRRLGEDRIDEVGPNAGFYERATAPEVCAHFASALEELVGSGRVRFLAMSDYRGVDADGHHVTSLLSGQDTTVSVRRKLVDATYVESSIPSRHTPGFAVSEGARLVPPNDLVDLGEAPGGFTVIGAGKTAMDTCTWLLDAGVAPDQIEWIRPRESWLFDRAFTQPLELVHMYMQLQAAWVEAAAVAEDGYDFAHRLEASGVFLRIAPDVEADIFRGATLSRDEADRLRSIERVVRGRKVLAIEPGRVVLSDGDMSTNPDRIHVDCTAAGLRPAPPRPVFERDRITMQLTTIGVLPWSAATVGIVEALRADESEKNRLCPPVPFSGNVADVLELARVGMTALMARAAEPDLATWTESCRLNPTSGVMSRVGDPRVAAPFTAMASNIGAALSNLIDRAPLNASRS